MLRPSILKLFLTGIFILAGCMRPVPELSPEPPPAAAISPVESFPVLPGIDVLVRQDFAPLADKRVGLVTNATGVNRQLVSTIDILFHAPEVNLVALYGPEHGVRGTEMAGAEIDSYQDPKTGLTVYSLYGETRKPMPDMLAGIDILVYDIQDVGCRSYTFISTMGLCLEACAEQGIPVVILDRPNPLGGNRIEGSIVQPGYTSFVGQFPIPYVYGLTPGELALFLKHEDLIAAAEDLDLTVVPMENWVRTMTFEDTGLEWVPTSPHVPHTFSPLYYVSSGVMGELGVVSEGVGYTAPFQFIGTEWVDEDSLAAALNQYQLPGVRFRPAVFKPYYGRDAGKYIHGVQVHLSHPDSLSLTLLQFYYLETLIRLYPDKNPFHLASESRLKMFDKVMGSPKVRQVFSTSWQAADVAAYFRPDETAFRENVRRYYLYP
ncbi:MAG: exo-beta-N-acetylmuramidase NamZ domain-containing protein [Fidelibacterota bacterium]